ncbi:hypothetical protein NE237_019651 [Protea cynaroides]|uniref:Uncharacterized protein n=1 Tax=Protea cynaroides TaxID=273540 RepID=A0A9Q0H6Y6_9MAGN|nr:hypothetical protein NE237_019651 [Protea cynaroides]
MKIALPRTVSSLVQYSMLSPSLSSPSLHFQIKDKVSGSIQRAKTEADVACSLKNDFDRFSKLPLAGYPRLSPGAKPPPSPEPPFPLLILLPFPTPRSKNSNFSSFYSGINFSSFFSGIRYPAKGNLENLSKSFFSEHATSASVFVHWILPKALSLIWNAAMAKTETETTSCICRRTVQRRRNHGRYKRRRASVNKEPWSIEPVRKWS